MKKVLFGSLIEDYSIKAKNDTNYLVCSVTNTNGFQNSADTFDKQVFSENLSVYKKVFRNSFAYNPSRINVGSIGIQQIDDCVLVSPLYNVFKFDNNLINSSFINYYIHSRYVKEYIKSHTQGTVRSNFKIDEMKKMVFPLYTLCEQQKIVSILDKITNVIDFDKRQLELLDEAIKSRFIEMFGSIESMHNSVDKLGDIVQINPRKDELDDDLKVSFIPMEKVGTDCSIDTSYERPVSEIKKGFNQIKENDVLFAKITPCMENGKSSIARGLINEYGYCTTELFSLRCNNKAMPEFVLTLVHMDEFRVLAKSNMKGAVGQQRVPKAFLENFPIAIPNIDKQKAYARFVGQIDKSKFNIQQHMKLMQELLDKKMDEYFN